MGQPVVHFEVIGRDAERLHGYYSELFGWEINADNPMNYGMVAREGNTNADGAGIGGGIGGGVPGHPGVMFYVEVPNVEQSLAEAERLGGSRRMGPEEIMPGLILGQFADPEGHLIGLVQAPPAG